jgi:16S rRNA (cytidine1402-2'-O)-methyltransferase
VSPTDEAPRTGILWIVATPIGTLGDFAPRAREVLDGVELILAEDTRRVGRLLEHAGVSGGGRVRSFHEHNEADRLSESLAALHRGASVALVSDAGTPVLSDPGFVLVRQVRREGLRVASVPGPSSFTAALAASGQPPLPATLVGFLPPKPGARRKRVRELAGLPWTVVILLSPHRLKDELEDLRAGFGPDRPATLLAELSKVHERAQFATLGELAAGREVQRPRGEYVVVVGPGDAPGCDGAAGPETIRELYATAIASGLSRKEAIKATAAELGLDRRAVFNALVTDRRGGK